MNDTNDTKKDNSTRLGVPALRRRDMMKMGAGMVAAAALGAPMAEAQGRGGEAEEVKKALLLLLPPLGRCPT